MKNKKVLFFSPDFFGIEKPIINQLISDNNEVAYFDERPFKSPFMKAITFLLPSFFNLSSNKYFVSCADSIKFCPDVILIVKGEQITPKTIRYLRIKFPSAKIVLYLWDSISNQKNILKRLRLYDRVLSFDYNDCERYGLIFRPLFSDMVELNDNVKQKKFDLAFFGTMYRDRFSIINEVEDECLLGNKKFYRFCYIKGKFMKLFYFLFNSGYRKMDKELLTYSPLSRKEISEIIDQSDSILDINDPLQSGLTIRTIETILKGKKLITTNQNIRFYDFYNENNIQIITRNNIHLSKDFWQKTTVPIEKRILERYSVKGWIKDVFESI